MKVLFHLTESQIIELEPLLRKSREAYTDGAPGMVIGQAVEGSHGVAVAFGFLDHATALAVQGVTGKQGEKVTYSDLTRFAD
jgi:hypothetical protein